MHVQQQVVHVHACAVVIRPHPHPCPHSFFCVCQGIVKLRAAGKLAAEVLNYAGTLIKAGVTTDSIDRAVHAMIIERGAYPSPLNYGK